MYKKNMAPEEIFDNFRTPEDQYRPVVMWFWNDRISEEEIAFQIVKFKESGILDFFVHPLWGMENEYLSPDFFKLIRHAVNEAKKNGMHFWIYDEYNWPSGMAGGYLLRDEPWTRSKLLKSMKVDLFAGQPANACFQGEFLGAQVIYNNKLRRIMDITDKVEIRREGETSYLYFRNADCAGCTMWIYYTDITRGLTTTGMWASFSWFQEGYVDTNNPDAVRKYIEYTHERYKEAVGDEFGKTVIGIFTDEVNNMSMFDNAPGITPWTGKLPEKFEAEHGYSLIPKLYALNCGFLDDEVLKVRYDYWRTCTRLFRDSYMDQVARWCNDNGLVLTGHLSGEGCLYWHAFQMGDFYEAMTPFDIPGIDNILSKTYIKDYRFSLAAKLVASVAKYNHKSRVMCETFSGSGWDMKLLDAKQIINRLLVHGINMMMYMGAYYSLDGARKKLPMGYPPSHGYNNPLFEHYEFLNGYTARISYLSSITYPAGRVMVMLPQIAQYIQPYEAEKLDFSWQGTVEALMRLNMEFDISFEPLANEMKAENGKLQLRGYEYDSVIIPAMGYTSERMAVIIGEFIRQGGKTVFVNALPEKAVDTGLELDFSSLWRTQAGDVVKALKEINANSLPLFKKFDSGNATAIAVSSMSGECMQLFMDALAGLRDEKNGAIYIDEGCESIFASHRNNDQMDVFFITNDHPDTATVTGTIGLTGRLVLMDPDSGEVKDMKTGMEAGRQHFRIEVPGYHMMAVACFKGEEPKQVEEPWGKRLHLTISLEGGWRFEAEGGNWLPLRVRFLKDSSRLLAMVQEDRIEELFAAASGAEKEAARRFAANELPGGYGVEFGTEYIAAASFTAEHIPEVLEFIVELEEDMLVFLNGKRLTGFEPVRLWGIREAQVDISGIACIGVNTLVIVSRVPSWGASHAIPSAFLRGKFCLDKKDVLVEQVDTIRPASWTRQGYPYFCGNGTYSTSFRIDALEAASIRIPTTDVVRIKVNGREVKVQPWPPYDVDITDFCRQGNNTLSLTFTSCYSGLMEVEKIELLEQGVTVYNEETNDIDSGLLSAPELVVYSNMGLA